MSTKLDFLYRKNKIPIERNLCLKTSHYRPEEDVEYILNLVFEASRRMIDEDKGSVLPEWIFRSIEKEISAEDFYFAIFVLRQIGVFKNDPFVVIDKDSPYLIRSQ